MRSRQERTAAHRLREAHFPDIKTLNQLGWKVLQGVSRPKLLELASCEYLGRADDVSSWQVPSVQERPTSPLVSEWRLRAGVSG